MPTLFGSSGSSGKSGGSTLFGGASFGDKPDDDPYSINSIQRQIGNAQMRVSDAGVNPDDSNKRNWFEEFTNLPPGQNAFLDTLDILTRGGNAVKNVIDKSMISDRENAGTAFYRGLSGRERVSGGDLAKKAGVDNKPGQFVGGLAADILLDPTTYIPGGVYVKGAKLAAEPIIGGAKAAYGALEAASPAVKAFRETRLQPAAESVKDGFGHIFKPQYKWENTLFGGSDDTLKTLSNETDNAIKYQSEESMLKIAKEAKDAGLQSGDDVGRIMENDLQINKNPDELLSDILKGRDVKTNLAEGELPDLLSAANKKILNSPLVSARVAKKGDQLQQVSDRIAKLENDFDIPDISSRVANGITVTEKEGKVLTRYEKYQKAQQALSKDIADTKRGIQFNPLETAAQASKGEGFAVNNPMPKLYKQVVGNTSKFLDDISPKGTFDQVVKPELANTLKPIVESLLRDGHVVTKNIKGTPEATELKRIFGDHISMHSKKNTTITLKQGNPNLKYYNLDGGKAVIPETLTDTNKLNPTSQTLLMDDIRLNNRIDNVNIPRPDRALSDSTEVNAAAKNLMDSNEELRQLASANGIDITGMSGYMAHILTEEARNALRMKKAQGGNFGIGQPNKAILKNRKYDGSVEDVNELMDKNVFNPNAFFATAIGQKRLIEYIHAETFKNKVLSNKNFAQPFQKGMTVPDGAVVINPDQFKFFKVSTPEGNEFRGMGKGQEYIVTKGAKQALDRYQKLVSDEGTKAFLKAFDTVQSTWKRFALFSIGYHARNLAGAMFNNAVGGMSTLNLAKYTPEAFVEVMNSVKGKESALFNEYRRQGLSSSGLSKVEFAKAGEEPEKAIQRTIESMSKSTTGKVLERLNPLKAFSTSRELGDFMDQTNRFALYKWARDKGMTPEAAAKKVKEVQFDYSRLTPVEQSTLARLVPFYRWMRNNIPYQIKSFINDPRKYANVDKARQEAQHAVGIDDENMPDYMKEQFNIPVFGKNGVGKSLGLNLPLTDLMKLSDPLKTLTDSLTPAIKTPLELGTNYNMFYRKPIQKFEGQEKQFSLGGVNLGGIPIKTAYALEQATGQIGRGVSEYLQKPDQKDNDTTFRAPSLGISSILKPFDAEEAKRLEQLQELKKLQDLILYIQQQQGEKPRTVREIKAGR